MGRFFYYDTFIFQRGSLLLIFLLFHNPMASYNQTIVVELGSSRIKVGFAGESKPRRVFSGDTWDTNDCSWQVPVNDGMGARPCSWGKFFQYLSVSEPNDNLASKITSVYEWERTLYPLLSHVLTSVLFVQRPSRHRILVVMNDAFPPRNLQDALTNVITNYLGVGGLLLVNGGGFSTISYILDGLAPVVNASLRPKAHLLVDVGTYESRAVVSVGGSILENTYQTTMSGYQSFLAQILHNYQADAKRSSGENASYSAKVTTLQDANAIVRELLSTSNKSAEEIAMTVDLSSLQASSQQDSVQLPVEPLQKAFHQVYLDYTNPSSLIYTVLASAMACPIDYKRIALQNVLLFGGGSAALRYFNYTNSNEGSGFEHDLVRAAQEACGVTNKVTESEEKKDEDTGGIPPIAKERFVCLKAAVSDGADGRGGMNVRYPEPFGADIASWIGGSIMGSLDLKNEEWQTKAST